MEFTAAAGAANALGGMEQFDNIWVASTEGNVNKVTTFLESGVSINSQDEYGFSPMHASASYGHVALLEYLLTNGADVNLRDLDGDTPLLICEDQASFEMLERHGADINATNNEGGGLAEKAVGLAEEGNEAMVTFLFNRGFIPLDFRMIEQQQQQEQEQQGHGQEQGGGAPTGQPENAQ